MTLDDGTLVKRGVGKVADLPSIMARARAGAPLWMLGIMSGTSVDGMDCAVCVVRRAAGESSRLQADLVGLISEPFDPSVRTRIFEAFQNGPGSLEKATGLAMSLGREYARIAARGLEVAVAAGLGSPDTALGGVAVHGQTLWHSPPPHPRPGTFQCIDPTPVSMATGVPVVWDFRRADMAVGGQGAPLVPFYDWNQYSDAAESRLVLNIGGIANLTVLPAGCAVAEVSGFDTGPGNVLIDLLMQEFFNEAYDPDGKVASGGKVIPVLLDRWMRAEYFERTPPKSTGRELFGRMELEDCLRLKGLHQPEDFVATATEWTAKSIAQAIHDFVEGAGNYSRLIVAGGGALNPVLMDRIQSACAAQGLVQLRVEPLDGGRVAIMAREAAAFAMMGYATLAGIPANVPAVTGATRPMVLGSIARLLINIRHDNAGHIAGGAT